MEVVAMPPSIQSRKASGPLFTPPRIALPQLDAAMLTLQNRAYSSPPRALHRGLNLIWQNSGQATHLTAGLRCCVQRLPATPDEAVLTVLASALPVLEPRLQGLDLHARSSALLPLVEHALAPVLDLIEKLSGHALVCEQYAPYGDGDTRANRAPLARIGFALVKGDGTAVAQGCIQASVAFWSRVDFMSNTMAPALSERLLAVPICFGIHLGGCRIPLTNLRELALGDGLRITPRLHRIHNTLPVRLTSENGRLLGRGRVTDDELTVDVLMATPMNSQPLKPAAPTLPSDGDLLSSIECDLSFEIGSLRMSLGDVAKLRAGQNLRLGVSLKEQPVRILTGGRQIGRGELAALGDELVVVVTSTHGLPPL